jgi:hypothetical protein
MTLGRLLGRIVARLGAVAVTAQIGGDHAVVSDDPDLGVGSLDFEGLVRGGFSYNLGEP